MKINYHNIKLSERQVEGLLDAALKWRVEIEGEEAGWGYNSKTILSLHCALEKLNRTLGGGRIPSKFAPYPFIKIK